MVRRRILLSSLAAAISFSPPSLECVLAQTTASTNSNSGSPIVRDEADRAEKAPASDQHTHTTSTLHGRVRNGFDRTPIAGGYVYALTAEGNRILSYARTSERIGKDNGSYTIEGLPMDEDILIVAFHPSFKEFASVSTVRLQDPTTDYAISTPTKRIPKGFLPTALADLILGKEKENASTGLTTRLLGQTPANGDREGNNANPYSDASQHTDENIRGILAARIASFNQENRAVVLRTNRIKETEARINEWRSRLSNASTPSEVDNYNSASMAYNANLQSLHSRCKKRESHFTALINLINRSLPPDSLNPSTPLPTINYTPVIIDGTVYEPPTSGAAR